VKTIVGKYVLIRLAYMPLSTIASIFVMAVQCLSEKYWGWPL